MVETVYYGYIRTACFRKAIQLMDAERITDIHVTRNIQLDKERTLLPKMASKAKYLTVDRLTTMNYDLHWTLKKASGDAGFPTVATLTLIEGGPIGDIVFPPLGDMVLQAVTVRFVSKKVSLILNAELETRKKEPVFTDKTQFFATFERSSDTSEAELRKIKEVVNLNRKEVEELGFKYSVMNLVSLRTERAVKYGEKEFISVNDNNKLVRAVLEDALDWDGWKAQYEIAGVSHQTKPCAIRCHQKTTGSTWKFINEEEI